MAQVKIDFEGIFEAAEQALKDTMLLMDAQLKQELSSPKWDYPVSPSPRDIVDTGRLRAAQELLRISPNEWTIRWPVDYAIYVHEGYTTRSGSQMPARRWTEVPLRLAQENFNKSLKYRLSR